MKSSKNISEALAKRAAQVQRGGARAAVLGVNDGLVSTVCLVVGVAAAGGSQVAVITAGLAGLLAGAISMAAGEWISVRTQVELFEGVLDDVRRALRADKKILTESLAHTLSGLGIKYKDARTAVNDVADNEDDLVSLYSSQVIGINQDELGSPWRAAWSSFILFAVGATVPILPWFISSSHGILFSVLLTAIAGLAVGATTAHLSGRKKLYGAARQFLIILGSALVTYGIGSAFGVVLG